jgi:hypothetical protein
MIPGALGATCRGHLALIHVLPGAWNKFVVLWIFFSATYWSAKKWVRQDRWGFLVRTDDVKTNLADDCGSGCDGVVK